MKPGGPPKVKRVATKPAYYLVVPLTHLVPPFEQSGGQEAFDKKVSSILEDVVQRGQIPSWVTDTQDVADFSAVVKEGGNKHVEVGVFRVAERSIGQPVRRETSETFEEICERLSGDVEKPTMKENER